MNIGSLRRIDELGRIVIPKTIRKDLKIEAGDNFEIYIKEEKIIMEKHSELSKEIDIEKTIAKTLKDLLQANIIVTDKDKIIIEEGKKNNQLPKEILSIIRLRKSEIRKIDKQNFYIKPIIVNGDITGSIIIKTNKEIDKFIINTVETMAKFLIKYIE